MTIDLDAIKARCAAATPGPWYASRRHVSRHHPDARGLGMTLPSAPSANFAEREDADFCAHAREDVPALVAEVERLRALICDVQW